MRAVIAEALVTDSKRSATEPIKIKKYANRRLYNTATSSYVTLEDLSEMVKEGSDFVVSDAKSGDDITHSVLTQIIFEQEAKGQSLLPISFLRQLIRFYGDSMQALVPSFLEISLDRFTNDQDGLRQQMTQAFGSPFGMFEDQVRKNMSAMSEAMTMFSPFKASDIPPGTPPSTPKGSAQPTDVDDIRVLKEQLAAMQTQLDKISRGGR